jgi:hypothetical protein
MTAQRADSEGSRSTTNSDTGEADHETRSEYVGTYVTTSKKDALDDIVWKLRLENRSILVRGLVDSLLEGEITPEDVLDDVNQPAGPAGAVQEEAGLSDSV